MCKNLALSEVETPESLEVRDDSSSESLGQRGVETPKMCELCDVETVSFVTMSCEILSVIMSEPFINSGL